MRFVLSSLLDALTLTEFAGSSLRNEKARRE
jgi:hypothetical protein